MISISNDSLNQKGMISINNDSLNQEWMISVYRILPIEQIDEHCFQDPSVEAQ